MRARQITKRLTPHSQLLTVINYPRRWGLVSHWRLENLADVHGQNVLTNNNAATFTAGKLGNALTLASASSQSASVASNATLQTGNFDFWLSLWVNVTTETTNRMLVCKDDNPTGREWQIYYDAAADRMNFLINPGASPLTVTANNFGPTTTGVWYFLMCYHDAVNDLIKISLNGGPFDSQATAGAAPTADTGALYLGRLGGAVPLYLNGQIDEFSFGKLPPLGIASLANEIRDRLYNGGAGRAYPFN